MLDVLELVGFDVFVGETLIELVGVGKRVYDSPPVSDNRN